MKTPKTHIVVGTKVAYSVQFLRSIGMSHSSNMAHARGEVTVIKSLSRHTILAKITWNNPDMPQWVNICNLAAVGLNRAFSNVD
jgi:hypothetical protein